MLRNEPDVSGGGSTAAGAHDRGSWSCNGILFQSADFLSRPPGFYVVVLAMVACTAVVPFGWTDVVTYALSVAAIIITGVVLIQGYRDTAAIHAKLDEIILRLRETRNDVIGLEHADPEEIAARIRKIEDEASCTTPELQDRDRNEAGVQLPSQS
jgi:low affinity Fe/Cu permease